MIYHLKRLACISLLFFISGCNISGTVAIDGKGVEGLTVVLNGNTEKTTLTDENGKYVFKSLKHGSYNVCVYPGNGYSGSLKRAVKKGYDWASVSHVDFLADASSARQISTGKIMGVAEKNGAHGYFGIPYAKPPVKELRWKAPQVADTWEGTYLALTPESKCTQVAGLLTGDEEKYFGDPVGSEDCLYMNLWSPSFKKENIPKDDKKLPVMLWIHGGGNSTGHGGLYDGKVLAHTYRTIVITINYRLGPFGWFVHPALREEETTEKDRSGNYGTMDILHALEWIQENIENFGGDPNNVTVFGESAGGRNILSLLISQAAEELFDRAIIQSAGVGLNTIAKGENYSDDPGLPGHDFSSREIINRLLVADGISLDRDAAKSHQQHMSNKSIRDFLYSKGKDEIMAYYGEGMGGMVSFPQIFRDGLIFPDEDMMALFSEGRFHQVPIIIGSNRDEAKLFMVLDPSYVDVIFGLPIIVKDKNFYKLAAKYKSDFWKAGGVDEIAIEIKKFTDDVFVYRFDWDEEPNFLGIDLGFMLGAGHGLELAYPFGTPDNFIVPSFKNIVYTTRNLPGRSYLAETMSSYWAEFAYEGNPGKGRDSYPGIQWEIWTDLEDIENTLIFDTPDDQGIHMTHMLITRKKITQALQDEDMLTQEQQCKLYKELVGEDSFFAENCGK